MDGKGELVVEAARRTDTVTPEAAEATTRTAGRALAAERTSTSREERNYERKERRKRCRPAAGELEAALRRRWRFLL